ncbi:long-chain fatty acid--CoA ligase [Microbacterium sp. C7(2022)]|uniref:AMP-dependent synthetase/ligase n=1 Tax=Microbacterium sp. C7(2022) TaxID=2992759 RepID=UPI00237A8816|nr:AMP-dependent synthetase/ligase [Microbacterium sp. C7(2022)]MDE0546210.1 AMP-dependent synthetase/ligase [Microbacterium sp. C7(2022)]
MQESATALLVDVDDHRNVTDLLVRRAIAAPDHAAFDVPDHTAPGAWHQVSTRAFLDEVRALAKGFIAVGVNPGDAIAIMAPTRYEWAVADLASWFAGAVVVPIYDTSSPTQVAAIVADAEVRVAIAGTDTQAEMLSTALDEAPHETRGVWSMDATLGELSSAGTAITDDELESRRVHAGLDSPATIVYTSGTTGEPKGAVLTHRNFLGQVLNIAAAYGEVVHPGGNTIIFLPLAHVLARGLQLICLASGMRIAHLSDTTAVVATLSDLRPTFLVVVPRVLQKIQAAAADKAAARGLSRVWRAATDTAEHWGRSREELEADAGTRVGVGLRVRRALFDRLFFSRLRDVMGGRVDYILSGGAALDAPLSLFFRGLGVPVIEGYGLTETTAPLTGNLPGNIRSGTVGSPLPGSEVRISDEGEILARGIGVFSGYRDPHHNATAFVDGYFRTGDLGRIDDEGRIILEGRLKDVIVTSNGKTIVPTAWERHVEASPLVAHAVMVGEGRSYLSALLLLDPEETRKWADAAGIHLAENGSEPLGEVVDAKLREHLQTIIDGANARVARSEQVKRFSLVSASPDDTTLITPTMKVKRSVVLQRAASAVEKLYA